MDIHSLQAIVIDALEDIKAQDIKLFDTVPLTSLFDRVAIVSGTSNRQTRALAAHVRDKVKQAGGDVISVEGEETGEWVLVDLGDMVVHVMQPTIRSYYNLEELWGEYPIDYKATKKNLSRRSASMVAAPTDDDSQAVKTPIARKGSAKKPAYEKGESTKAKPAKAGGDKAVAGSTLESTKPAKTKATASKPKRFKAAGSDALEPATSLDSGATKTVAKTLPWRAAADKPRKTESKAGAKSPVRSAAPKAPAKKAAPTTKVAPRTLASKAAALKPAPVKSAPARKSPAKK
jgi:ribosome-associated protein